MAGEPFTGVTVARILRPWGRRGEVAAEILTDFPERLASRGEVWLAGGGQPPRRAKLLSSKVHLGQVILHFAGSESISDAERLRGLELQVPQGERMALDPTRHYITDLIGCQVWEEDAAARFGAVPLGVVEDVLGHGVPVGRRMPESWRLVVATPEGELLIPLAAEICTRVDTTARRIEVRLPPGLRELNRSASCPAYPCPLVLLCGTMRFDIVTIFPEFFSGPLDYGIVRRAREARLVDMHVQDLRSYTHNRHRTVDDRPFGGGEGMVLKPEPLFEAVESLLGRAAPATVPASAAGGLPETPSGRQADGWPPSGTAVVLLSASGQLFRQATAACLAGLDRVVLLCGRYEGVDERVAEHLATHELSIGDYVLSGGELAAALIVEAVTRLIPGALGNEASAVHESFSTPGSTAPRRSRSAPTGGTVTTVGNDAILLDCPHYTRPAEFRGWPVPEVLLGGNHQEIRLWRRQTALEKTQRNRPDLLGLS